MALFADQTWTNANSSQTMTVSGAISGDQNLSLSGNINLSGSIGGNDNLTFLAGSISLGSGSPSTFVGNIHINGGTVTLNGGAPWRYDQLGDLRHQQQRHSEPRRERGGIDGQVTRPWRNRRSAWN